MCVDVVELSLAIGIRQQQHDFAAVDKTSIGQFACVLYE